jgi:hypothetical protein
MIAMDDFETFKKLMCKRNMELELEAIRTYSSSTHKSPPKGMNANYKELNEDRRLEQALAESLQMSNANSSIEEEKDGIHVYIDICIHIYICIYRYMYTYIYTYIYTCQI